MNNEEWRPVPGLPNVEASSLGSVRHRGTVIVGSVSKSTGYRRTKLSKRERLFHALVAAAFIGERPTGAHVNHKNCNKTDNRPENLEYVTPRENMLHAHANGRTARGARHGRYTKPEGTARGERVNTARLTEPQVREIRALRSSGARYADIAARFNISPSQACNVASGAQWRHVK